MFGRIIETIWALRDYMALSAGCGLALGLMYLVSLKLFGWNRQLLRIHGLFTDLTIWDNLLLCGLYLRFMLLIYSLLSMRQGGGIYPAMLICMAVLLVIAKGSIRGIFEEAGNTLLFIGGLYAEGILLAYMREIRYETGILMIYILAGLFILQYALYFILRDIKNISKGREKKWKKKRDDPG
jgi:hypothetical protein